jgi:L-lactate utilization protein LutB
MTGDTTREELATRFGAELEAVWGAPERCDSHEAALTRAAAIIGDRPARVDDHPDLAGLHERVTTVDNPEDAEVGVTGVLVAASETGTLVLAPGPGQPRATSLVPPEHLALVPLDRLVATYADAIDRIAALDALPSSVHLITGPSRSADIELTPIRGVHGPERVRVLLY